MSAKRRTLGRKTAITSQSMLAALALATPAGPGPAKTKATSAPAAKAPATTAAPRAAVTGEERRRMIARVAYARAERARFSSNPVEDWLSAEREVDAEIARAS